MYRINKSLSEYWTAVKLALVNLYMAKSRSFLSVLGIVIGVVAVIVVVSSGQAVREYIIGQIESFGTDVIQVESRAPQTGKNVSSEGQTATSSTETTTTFKLKDAEELSRVSESVESWYAALISQQVFSYQDENETALIFGTTAGVTDVDGQIKIGDGRFYADNEDDGLSQVVVLGSKLKENIFGDQDAVGKSIKIKNSSYKVVGVLEPRGSVAFFDFDSLAYVPLQTLQKKIMGVDYIQAATFKLESKNRIEAIMQDMRLRMRDLHDIDRPSEDDFVVSSIEEATDIIGSVFKYINWLLIGLTVISLIVGGVNIMNVMYVAVSERTFEIGLRKAVGASEANIRHQFLFEAVVISFAGALLGIALGSGIMVLLSRVAFSLGYNVGVAVSLQAIVISLAFSLIAGIIFGYYPAQKASKLTPVEALRK